ncbi:hypothetical protein ACU4GD_23215 [Cupriavidus basilensis]
MRQRGNLGRTGKAAGRNFPQRLPHALKRRAADIQRQVQANGRRLDKTHHLRHQRLKTGIAADEVRLRETGWSCRLAREGVGIVAQQDRAPARRPLLRDQDRTERGLPRGKAEESCVCAPPAR